MSQKTDAQLKIETDNVIKVNGNSEITPPKDNALRTNIIDSKINKEGGNVVTGLLGYTTDLTPTDDKHLVSKKYVDDSIDSVEITTDATPTDGSTNPVQSGGVYDALVNKQDTLTEGQGIDIDSGVISVDLSSYSKAGNIDISISGGASVSSMAISLNPSDGKVVIGDADLSVYPGKGIDLHPSAMTSGVDVLNIGESYAEVVNIGRTGATVNFLGQTNLSATEQEVLDHTEGSKFASPATIKKHTMITKLSLYTNFA